MRRLADCQLLDLVFVVGWKEGKEWVTDTYHITPGDKPLTLWAMKPYEGGGKNVWAFRLIHLNGVGEIHFHPGLNAESREYAETLIKKNYPLPEGYLEIRNDWKGAN